MADISSFWQQQAEIMELRAPVSAEPPELALSAESSQPADEEQLQAKKARAAKIGAWLEKEPISHPRWAEGASLYRELMDDIRAVEEGPFWYLRRGGDEEEFTILFPADTPIPQISGKWQRLPDGSIETRVSVFELRVMREMAIILGIIEGT